MDELTKTLCAYLDNKLGQLNDNQRLKVMDGLVTHIIKRTEQIGERP